MKLHRFYLLSLIVVMLTVVSFDLSSPQFIDNTAETKVEVSLEEKEAEKKSDENLLATISARHFKEIELFSGFYFSLPIVNQRYLDTIFKPPIALNA
ncbi:hypothetical protein [Sulfurovum mangrovi]|uniref:hypothetical protein n=1 Tax=Sulfurovum mangrovi TaxID=2893889 RepID=UPI001E42CD8D|nr:hypothetical protein [Sulfurovum mangrovi]UFH58063.1 hypothetical protein LN246_06835 [Sulfurovum mangrovi]